MPMFLVASPAHVSVMRKYPKAIPGQTGPPLRLPEAALNDIADGLNNTVLVTNSAATPSLAVAEFMAKANTELEAVLNVTDTDGNAHALTLENKQSRPVEEWWVITGGMEYAHPMKPAPAGGASNFSGLAYEGRPDGTDGTPMSGQLYAPIVVLQLDFRNASL